MKLLQIPNYMFPNIGGIEQTARDIAAAVSAAGGTEQKIICFNEDAASGSYVCRRHETVHDTVDGIEVIRCGCFAKVMSQSVSLNYPEELKRLLTGFDPDTVIFHYPNPFVASFFLPMLKRTTRLILYWHLDITKQKNVGKLFHRQTLKLLERADRVVATSPNYIDGSPYLSRFREKCCVIPSCIDESRLAVTPRSKALAEHIRERFRGKTIVFAVGRHVEYKGMIYLVRAAQELSERFEILIGGKGPLTGDLFREKGENSHIHMLGRVSDEMLTACMLACDIFAFPSVTKNEAFGLALAEGMYFGKPAVTFNIPGSGVNYVSIGGVTGIECQNGNSRALVGAIRSLAADDALRKHLGNAARQRVLDNFMFDKFSAGITRLLEEVKR